MIASIFRKSKEYHQLSWVRKEDDTLASKPEEVGKVVSDFFHKWFKSRVSVEERWGSWENMMNLNTDQVKDEFKSMVDECYLEPMQDMKERAEATGMWDHFLDTITEEELIAAIKKVKPEKARESKSSLSGALRGERS